MTESREGTDHGDRSPREMNGAEEETTGGIGFGATANSDDTAPRKRSKVSRACDACRRKKIRCDAELSSSLHTVTKICNNCSKNNEKCTFSRVPLKRGPSKGYIRELEDKLEGKGKMRNKSLPIENNNQPLPYPRSMSRNSVADPTATSPTSASSKATGNQSGSPIILPPLIGTYSQPKINILPPAVASVKNIDQGSNPSSPLNNHSLNGILNPPSNEQGKSNSTTTSTTPSSANIQNTHSPPIQGPFWKVPYEMPGSNNSINLGSIPFGGNHNRKSSLDSVSSNSSNGSRSRLPSLKATNSISSDMGISDSDDDFYSTRSFKQSRHSSQSLSPRNSLSSLSSLNGRMNKNLILSQQPQPHQQLVHPQHGQSVPSRQQMYYSNVSQIPPAPGPHVISYATPQSYSNFSVCSLEQNLSIYYTKFHPNFPILPLNQKLLTNILDSMVADEQSKSIVDLFNYSLTNLNNFQVQSINDNINLILRILQLYPFNNFGVKLNDNVLFLFFSSLILINYAILLNGDTYSLGISLTVSILNDFKVLENFRILSKSNENNLELDDIKLYLPKLYYCLTIIDNFHCISFGIQRIVPYNKLVEYLYSNTDKLIPAKINNTEPINFKIANMLNDLIISRDEVVSGSAAGNGVTRNHCAQNISEAYQPQDFALCFINLVKDKYDLISSVNEIYQELIKIEGSIEDEDNEIIHDYHLKLGRLIKKLSQSIINLANYISTISSQSPNTNSPGSKNNNYNYELSTPILNISFGQSYKLIKLCKLIIDGLVSLINDSELTSRCIKINNDLSIAFNLMNSNLNKSFNPSIILGQFSINLIKNKIDFYNLNFNNVPNNLPKQGNSMNLWKIEFLNSIKPFIDKEDTDGWY